MAALLDEATLVQDVKGSKPRRDLQDHLHQEHATARLVNRTVVIPSVCSKSSSISVRLLSHEGPAIGAASRPGQA